MVNVGTRTLAWTAGKMARSWTLGRFAQRMSNLAGRVMPDRKGLALNLAAERAGFDTYQNFMLSFEGQKHSSTLRGDFIGANYFAFGFHFAFVSCFLFPKLLQEAVDNPGLFYLKELSSSMLIAAGLTAFMITGHMATTARRAFKTANLSENIEKQWNEALAGGFFKRTMFYLSAMKITLGTFPGVTKQGFTYKLDGESPLNVSAAGPRHWDRVLSWIGLGISAPLITLAVLAASGEISELPAVWEWVTRVVIPMTVISKLGQWFSNDGANKTFIVNRDLGGNPEKVSYEAEFDLTNLKTAFEKGGDE